MGKTASLAKLESDEENAFVYDFAWKQTKWARDYSTRGAWIGLFQSASM